MNPKIAVVILNWNGRHYLEQFLPSLIKYSKNDAEIIIADNHSTDNSLAFLKRNYPKVRVIENKENGGFSKGYNEAFGQIEADYFILLNSDIEVSDNWIRPVIALMESDEKIAVCQPKLLSWHEPQMFEYAGAAGGFIDRWGYPFCRGRVFMAIENDFGQYDDVAEVFWATGACMFVRSEIYTKFGGLDEDFFAHMEEIDFCWRLKNDGYKIMYTPESKVFHVGGGTLPKSSSYKTYLNFRNSLFLLLKNLSGKRLWVVLLVRLLLDGIAGLRFLLTGYAGDFRAVIKAHLSFYKSFKKIYAKRENIHHQKINGIFKGSIAYQHFLKKKLHFSQLPKDKFL